MTTGSVHSWDLSTGVDGPGTRLTVFLAGCPLRCLYCQNPDTWSPSEGRLTSVDDLMSKVLRYRKVFDRTGGGVTLSGGEPLQQPEFTAAIFHACRELGIPTALDTSGALGADASDALLADTSLVLLDIKSFESESYSVITRVGSVTPTLRFAERLDRLKVPVWVRFVVVPGVNDDESNVEGLASFVAGLGNVERVDVIGFHRLGEPKYQALGIHFPLQDAPATTFAQLHAIRRRFADKGLVVT